MIRELWYKFFWGSYDNLWKLMFINFIIAIMATPLVMVLLAGLHPLIGYLISVITIPAPLSALFYFAARIEDDREPKMKTFFRGMKKYFLKGTFFYIAHTVIITALVFNAKFYLSGKIFPEGSTLGMILSGICFWAAFYSAATAVYTFPLMVNQDVSIKKIIIRANLMTLGKPLFTLSAIVNIIFFGVIVVATKFVLLYLFFISFSAVMMNSAYQTVIEYYEEQEEKLKAENADPDKPKSWKDVREAEAKKQDKPRRSFREIFKPWEY